MRHYRAYKDSGIPWIKEIPEHWEIDRAKNLFNKMSRPIRQEDEVVTCFRDGEVTLRKNRRLDGFTESLKEIGYQGIRKGDLVIHQMDAFAGAIGVSDSDGKGTPVYICLQPNGAISNYYYAYLLREMSRSGYITALYRGIRERSSDFRYDTFSRLFLPVPPLDEQEAIVAYLDKETERIDRLVELLTAQRERYALLKRSLISEVVTKGLPQHDPVTFRRLRLKDVSKINPSVTKVLSNDDEVSFIPMSNVFEGYYVDDETRSFESVRGKYSGFMDGDIVLAKITPCFQNGNIAIVDDLKNGVGFGSTELVPIRVGRQANKAFVFYFLRSQSFVDDMTASIRGVGGLRRIDMDRLRNAQIALPSLSEQQEIVDYLDERCGKIDRLTEAIDRKIELLRELRKSLIEEVVTGKRCVIN